MESQEHWLQERNREIGRILQEARVQQDVSVSTCASLVGTSRRRYSSLEAGEAATGIAE
jgi:predicted transcriptional regulator